MKVTLAVPPEQVNVNQEWLEYLGLGYVAAAARQRGHRVDILDCRFQPVTHTEAAEKIKAQRPDVVGITASYALDLTSAVKLAQALRAAGYEGMIMAGGHPATATYSVLLTQFPAVNVVVRGEGEITFADLLDRLETGQDWRATPGIAFQQNGKVTVTPPRRLLTDLDSLPVPARDNVCTDGAPSSAVLSRSRGLEPATVILSSRGCPFQCTYCSVQSFYRSSPGPAWRARSAQNVVDEMAQLAETWGFRFFRFSDDNFFGSCRKGRLRAEELAKGLLGRKLRVNFVIECCATDVEFSLFSLLKRAGLVRVSLGIESGVPRMLEMFNKRATVENNKTALAILRELGIEVHPNFILVDPETTLEELRQNLDFFKNTRVYLAPRAFHILYTNRLGLFAGTPLYENMHSAGRTRTWIHSGFTEEDQKISETLGAVLDYEDQDPRVTLFLKIHKNVISKLTQRDFDLARLEQQLRVRQAKSSSSVREAAPQRNAPGLLPPIERWRANVGRLALRLFEKALMKAEQGEIKEEGAEEQVQDFLSDLNHYDILHFGRTVDELLLAEDAAAAAA